MNTQRVLRTALASFAIVTSLGLAASAHGNRTVMPPLQSSMTSEHAPNVRLHRVEVPAGTWIRARMDSTVSTTVSGVGTPFYATVATPVYDANNRVIVPEGTKLLGRVQGSMRGHRFGGGSQIAIGIDAIQMHGQFVPLTTIVSGVARDTFRTGVFFRQQAQVRRGAVIQVRLESPATVAVVRETLPVTNERIAPPAVGGGPRPGHRHHARPHRHATPQAQCPPCRTP